MELKLIQRGLRPTQKAVKMLERQVGAEVPCQYIEFLQTNHGGTATGYWFRSKRTKHYINTFLAVVSSPRGPITIQEVMSNCEGMLPEQIVPVAFTDGDNLLLIRVDAKRHGQVDLYIACESNAHKNTTHKVAKSFGDFLAALQYTDPAELDDDDYGLW